MLKSDEVALEVAEAELAKLTASSGDSKVTRMDYIKHLSAIATFKGFILREKDLTLAEYIAVSNEFTQHIENQKRTYAKGGN